MRRWVPLGLAVVFFAGCGGRPPDRASSPPTTATPAEPPGPPPPEVQATLQAVLEPGRHPWLTWPDVSGVVADARALYASEPDGLFWFRGAAPHPSLDGALEALTHCDRDGLRPEDYDAAPLSGRLAAMRLTPPTLTDRALFDLAVTVSAMRLLQAAHWGRVDPRNVGFDYDVTTKRLDLVAALRAARDDAGLTKAVADTHPQFPVYDRLVNALAKYRGLAAAEPPLVAELPAGLKKVEPGKPWAAVAALDARLRAFGDIPVEAAPPAAGPDGTPIYQGPQVDGVKRFQARHALEADGVIGRGTIQALNVTAAARVRQIELSLERERWLPEIWHEPLIFVNVPLFRLWGYDPERPTEPLRMSVVAGKAVGHATPIFIDEMEYVIFRPYWNPPPSILRSEILPHARKDGGYLDRQSMEIVASGEDTAEALPATPENLDKVASGRLYLRQKPGEKNSLGLAKFIFPNTDNIYMHGTPAQSLFTRARRDFSHGCIRLEDPARLAAWVLRNNPEWTPERIEAAMKGTRPTQVNLRPKLKVVLFYDTAYVDSKGVVHFTDDYYGHDARLEKALAGGYPYPRQS